MDRKPMNSSNIVAAGYEPTTETLEVEFKGGVVWQYTHFPQSMWEEFLSASSRGKYFSSQVLPRFGKLGYRVQ